MRTFRPLPHRLQTIAERNGVRFVDDSKATNPGAVVAALEALDGSPIVLIAGGKSKRTDFAEMGVAIGRRAKAAVLIGEAADEIAAAVSGIPVERAAIHGPSRRDRAPLMRAPATRSCFRRAARRSTCSTRRNIAADEFARSVAGETVGVNG